MESATLYSIFILLVLIILAVLWFGPYDFIVEEEED